MSEIYCYLCESTLTIYVRDIIITKKFGIHCLVGGMWKITQFFREIIVLNQNHILVSLFIIYIVFDVVYAFS